MEQYIIRIFRKEQKPAADITIIEEIQLQDNKIIKSSDDTDSLLDENGEIFTSPRINRTYTPYETEVVNQTNLQTSHVPVVDTNDV